MQNYSTTEFPSISFNLPVHQFVWKKISLMYFPPSIGSSYDPTTLDSLYKPGENIFMHPLYIPSSSAWLNLKIFYVRLSNCEFDQSLPEHLTVNFIPLSPDTILEVNGRKSGINTEFISSTLRRDGIDKNSEAIFVSTDSIRMTGNMRFEVSDSEHLLLSGVLELSKINGFTGESKSCTRKWSMKCKPVISSGLCFWKGKQFVSQDVALPTIEVYAAGWFSGSAIIFTKTLHLGICKKNQMRLVLDSVPENEATGAQQLMEYEGFAPENDVDIDYSSIYRRSEYMETDDRELSLFNAGVRVGLGLGLTICLCIGIGAGLLFRTYQATTNNFKRRLL